MKKTAMFLLALLLLLCLSACAASPQDGRAENVYLTGALDGEVLTSAVNTLDIYAEIEAAADTPAQEAEVVLCGNTHVLPFSRLRFGTYEYNTSETTADNPLMPLIRARFDILSGKLLFLTVDGTVYPIPEQPEEAQYIEWIKTFVAQYYEEDWGAYTYSCMTTVEGSEYEGFRVISDDESFGSYYTFSFVKYIDGIATSDRIWVSINPRDGRSIVEFSAHQFDQMESLDVDLEEVTASLDAFLQKYINSEKYQLLGYEVQSPKVTSIDGELYYQCSLETTVKLRNIAGDPSFEELIPVVVQLPQLTGSGTGAS